MTTVYAIYSASNQAWITRSRDYAFELNTSCLFDKAPKHLAGTIYQLKLEVEYEWENEPKEELPRLELKG